MEPLQREKLFKKRQEEAAATKISKMQANKEAVEKAKVEEAALKIRASVSGSHDRKSALKKQQLQKDQLGLESAAATVQAAMKGLCARKDPLQPPRS